MFLSENSGKEALLLIDIQNDYFEYGTMELIGPEIAADNAKVILDKFRSKMLPVIHIQHVATKSTATFFLPGTKGAEIHDKVKPLPTEKIIIKHYPNGFLKTELLDYLKKNNIDHLVICGMMTHMCVDATTRAAKDVGFNCILIEDGCATKDLVIHNETVKSKDVQNSFLAALSSTYATLMTVSEYMNQK